MNIARFDAICGALRATERVIQWGDSHVWKVGGKIFAIAVPQGRGAVLPSFKASDAVRPMLLERAGIEPAPYLARAGWVCMTRPDALSDEDLAAYLGGAHACIAAALSKRLQASLGFTPSAAGRTSSPRRASRDAAAD